MESQLFGNLPNWVTPLLTFAAAFGGIKMSLNGARKDITEIKGDVKEIRTSQAQHGERIAALEAKSDA